MRKLDLWWGDERSYRALMGRVLGRVAVGSIAAIALALVGASTAWALPTGAVGGVQNPATSGALVLDVLATTTGNDGVGLSRATAEIDGVSMASMPFEAGACRLPEVVCPATVTLNVVTLGLSDGLHQLDVLIVDEQERAFVSRRIIEVDNTPPVNTPIVVVDIGSGSILPSPPGPGGPVGPDAGPACAFPRLSMFLAQDPLRFRRGVPVLAEGRKYRFQGQLTCVVDGRRRPAARGTEVQVLHRTSKRLMRKSSLSVRGNGRLSAKLAFPSRRVVIFRVRGAGSRTVQVRIPIRTADVRRGRR